MYLVGDLTNRDYFQEYSSVKFKAEITREDLSKTKTDSYWQVINLENRTYFDPQKNEWLKIETV